MPKKKSVILIDHAMMETVEDRYREGEVGPLYLVWETRHLGAARSLADIIDKLEGSGIPVPKDPRAWIAFEAGRLDCGFLVDEENYMADDADIEMWKRDKKKLFAATVSVLISFADVWTPTDKVIAKRLGIETYD